MARKFKATVEFDLATSIGPDATGHDLGLDVEDFADNSYFDENEVECGGGEVTFTVMAEDEDDAEDKARQIVWEGLEVNDDHNVTWVVTNVRVEVEALEMSKEEALAVIRRLIDRLVEQGTLTDAERTAFDVILQDV